METRIITLLIFLTLSGNCFSQIDPLSIVDKAIGSLLPTVSDGISNIVEAKKKDKDEEAEKLEKEYKEAQAEAITKAKKDLVAQIGKDIDLLNSINLVHSQIQLINNHVGRLSIFKDIHFNEVLRSEDCAVVKHEIVRIFQNTLQQVLEYDKDFRTLQSKLSSTNLDANSRAKVHINKIISELGDIKSSYDDCPQLKSTTTDIDQDDVDACLSSIRAIIQDINDLEGTVNNLNTEISAMISSHLNRFQKIKDGLGSKD